MEKIPEFTFWACGSCWCVCLYNMLLCVCCLAWENEKKCIFNLFYLCHLSKHTHVHTHAHAHLHPHAHAPTPTPTPTPTHSSTLWDPLPKTGESWCCTPLLLNLYHYMCIFTFIKICAMSLEIHAHSMISLPCTFCVFIHACLALSISSWFGVLTDVADECTLV